MRRAFGTRFPGRLQSAYWIEILYQRDEFGFSKEVDFGSNDFPILGRRL